ncbi:MbtH family protein, partial [Streptomyces sp. CO7]
DPRPHTHHPTLTTEGTDMDENTRYQVLRNDEDQYSLWPVDVEVPAGWQPVGKEGTEAECSAYVDEVWTDMRPRSLRERMENAEA